MAAERICEGMHRGSKSLLEQCHALYAYLRDSPTIEDAREFLMTSYQDLSSEGMALLSTFPQLQIRITKKRQVGRSDPVVDVGHRIDFEQGIRNACPLRSYRGLSSFYHLSTIVRS
jgi:hypothetical protein